MGGGTAETNTDSPGEVRVDAFESGRTGGIEFNENRHSLGIWSEAASVPTT